MERKKVSTNMVTGRGVSLASEDGCMERKNQCDIQQVPSKQ